MRRREPKIVLVGAWLLSMAGLLDPIFGVLIVGLPSFRGPVQRALSSGFAVLLGEASYAVYILQVPIA